MHGQYLGLAVSLVESGDVGSALEGRGGAGAGDNVEVQGGEQVLLVVGVKDPGSGVVSELAEGIIGGGENGLDAGRIEKRCNAG